MLIVNLMEQIPFFWEFTSAERQALATSDPCMIYGKAGDLLIQEDADDHAMLVVLEGTVRVFSNANPDVAIATLGPGAVIGEMAFLTESTRNANVVAEEPVTVFRVDRTTMTQLDPFLQIRIQSQLCAILVERLTETQAQMLRQKEINQTLAKALSRLSFGR